MPSLSIHRLKEPQWLNTPSRMIFMPRRWTSWQNRAKKALLPLRFMMLVVRSTYWAAAVFFRSFFFRVVSLS